MSDTRDIIVRLMGELETLTDAQRRAELRCAAIGHCWQDERPHPNVTADFDGKDCAECYWCGAAHYMQTHPDYHTHGNDFVNGTYRYAHSHAHSPAYPHDHPAAVPA